MKDTRNSQIDYAILRENVERVARHWNLDVKQCWQAAKDSLPRSAESYRMIAHSLKTRVEM